MRLAEKTWAANLEGEACARTSRNDVGIFDRAVEYLAAARNLGRKDVIDKIDAESTRLEVWAALDERPTVSGRLGARAKHFRSVALWLERNLTAEDDSSPANYTKEGTS